jgi:hypothetical protein
MFNMVQAYAARNRIPSLHLPDQVPSADNLKAIPVDSLLPSEDDAAQLRASMTVMVERILVQYVPFLAHLRDDVTWHIPHQYTTESARRSELVCKTKM